MRRSAWLWILALGLTACAANKPQGPAVQLELRPNPPSPAELLPGSHIEIMAVAVPATELQWVSGTVKLFRAPVLTFKKDPADGNFKFKTMIPPMVQIPAGTYEIKAWGRTVDGAEANGRMDYVVR